MKARAEFSRMVRVSVLGSFQARHSRDPQKVVVSDFISFLLQEGICTADKHGFVGPTTYVGFFWEEDIPKIAAWFQSRELETDFLDRDDFQDPPSD